MKLSVVIPVYNAEDFIEKSYRSILGQQMDDFEIIYVNNNSNDTSVACINGLKSLDSRIKLLHQKKQGAASARNMGIRNALGDYIYVFDVDDEIYPNAIKKMMSVLDTNTNVDAVFGKLIKSNKSIAETTKPSNESFDVVFKEKPFWGLKWFSDLGSTIGPPGFLYRKSVFEKIGFYNEKLKNNEDTALDIKLGMLCNVAFLDMYVYLYFKHSSSTIEQSKKQMDRVFMMWPRLVHEHLPFYLNNKHENQFGHLLKQRLFGGLGKQVFLTKGFRKRKLLVKKLTLEITPIKPPWLLRLAIALLVVFPNPILIKIYGYYIVPYTVKNHDI